MRVSSLPKAVTWKRTGRNSNPRPFGSRANALPLSHTGHTYINVLNGKYGDSNILAEFTQYYKNIVQRHTASDIC